MNKNNFISYKIENTNASRNCDESLKLLEHVPINSYEIKIANIPILNQSKNIKNNNENLNITVKVKRYEDKSSSLLNNLSSLKNFNGNVSNFDSVYRKKLKEKILSSMRNKQKKIKMFLYNKNTNYEYKLINTLSKPMIYRNNNNNINSNNITLIKKLKKFNSSKNIILGRYPASLRLLNKIQDKNINDNKLNSEEKVETIEKNKIYPIKEKPKKENTINHTKKKSKNKGISQTLKKLKKKIFLDNANNDGEYKELKLDLRKKHLKYKHKGKLNNSSKDYNLERIDFIIDIKKKERFQTLENKMIKINEYNDRIRKINSEKIQKQESNNKIEKKNMDNENENINKRINNKLEYKSNSISSIHETKKNDIKRPITLKSINLNSKINNPLMKSKKEEKNILNETEKEKENIKKKEKEENKEDNLKSKETQNDIEKNNSKEELYSTVINKDKDKDKEKNKIKKNNFSLKEEYLERFIKTRKEYLEKEKTQSLQNISELYYLVFPGNSSYLIKNCMKHRSNWKEPFSNVTSFYNFKWTELSYSLDYSSLGIFSNSKQIVNHYENHSVISNKANMFINLMNYCEKNKISVFKYVPFTIIYNIKDRRDISKESKEIYRIKNNKKLETFLGRIDKYLKKYEDLGKYYFEEKFINKDKNKNNSNINNNKDLEGINEKFASNDNNENKEIKDNGENEDTIYSEVFENIYKKEKEIKIGSKTFIEIPLSHYTKRNKWVIKAINLNRGMCIKIVDNFSDMEKVIDKFRQGVNFNFTEESITEEENKETSEEKEKEIPYYYCDNIIIQKYIENPLLYRGRKFDIRIWVLLTHQMKVFVFKEGHLKTCSVNYDINSRDSFSHITNYSFQKNNNNFEKYEIGNEVPFFEFQKYLDEKYKDKSYSVEKDLMVKIKDIVNISMKSIKDLINKNNKNYQFEIFGYDFMIDCDFNVFLIEINTNPGLEESSPWIKVIVPRMLDDALRLTLDQLFETKYDFSLNYKNEEDSKNLNNVIYKLKNKENPNSLKCVNEDIKNYINIENNNENMINEKNKKYISPFYVPGYDSNDNLWDFVCDLNEIENKADKEIYTGIKHLLKKKKNDKAQ